MLPSPSPTKARRTSFASPKSERARRWLALTLLLLALTGCAAVRDDPAPATSAWGPILTLAQAAQGEAPALTVAGETIRAAWTTSDDGPQSLMWTGTATNLHSQPSPPAERLTLPAVFPHAQTVLPAASDHTHLLWLDADPADASGQRRLWLAVVTPDLLVERGPFALSDDAVSQYAASGDSDLGAWVVWSSGPLAEPDLYARSIDRAGRPRLPQRVIQGADWPALVHIDDTAYLLFQRLPDRRLTLARLDEDGIADLRMVAPWPRLQPGDRLAAFSAGVDRTHVYALWVIARASGAVETWWTSGPLDAAAWPDPAPLAIAVQLGTTFETGFNGGAAQVASNGDSPMRWSSPLPGHYDRLALAAQVGDALGLLYLEGGAVRAFQPVATLPAPGLIGPPAIRADRDRHLTLAWSQPDTPARATLHLTTTRRP